MTQQDGAACLATEKSHAEKRRSDSNKISGEFCLVKHSSWGELHSYSTSITQFSLLFSLINISIAKFQGWQRWDIR